ncbi:S8 family peptidase [Nigerium massiliense]|uniref:S8 family peptidase n=1 Tax=Nigerium massiliense TaxID=1522317 RepID=UPI00058DAA63|nr:S8 family serine peptidase [Nigerium massiliense]
MRRSKILIATGIFALALPATAASAAPNPADKFLPAPSSGRIDSSVLPASLQDDSRVDVIVQMKGDPVAVVEAKTPGTLSSSQRASIRSKLAKQQDAISGDIARKGGRIEATMQSAYNGIRVSVKRNQVPAIAKLSNVAGIHGVTTFTRNNATSVPFLGVPQVWKNTGYTGKNVRVAIIDTGIDYTHADFGGPGTVEAYTKAHATETQPADPALFGPNAPRVKGGWDFVGDNYDANKPDSVAKPDPNPLDCQGHGSHVAGTTAGGGVTADGKAYTGPYDDTTPSKKFKVGPGVAPQADLYAVRVFGCSGSTNVTTEAIDWAVKNGMNVVNMSLGSPYGRVDDPTAVAAANAVASGVVVVTSAGNSGPNPYITGAPGVGRGVISVAAMDATESYPGANIKLPDGSTVGAVNANGAPIPTTPFTVVVLKDDPATTEDESLGCSTEAYTKNGVNSASQLAVSKRGTCARVAKAIWAQKAGAGAALMINNAPIFPPYEGEITEDPDTGEKYTVTIPFLGVRSTDGPKIVAAEGKQVTLAAAPLANPGFRKYGSFSSGGPRNGDSGLKPAVSAPGVSIASAGVGTGSDVAIMSGTSMASPHVAGVAALTVQAHPGWTASDVSAAIVSTADPSGQLDYRLTLGGAGLVDTAQSVSTKAIATGDTYVANGMTYKEPSLSFGFQESTTNFRGSKTVTVINHGTKAMTFTASNEATPQSRPATVRFSPAKVTVQPGGQATLKVNLTARVKDVMTSTMSKDQFNFREVSGNVKLTSGNETLRVPYLLVPRGDTKLTATSVGAIKQNGTTQVRLANRGGAYAANADFFTWGLQDAAGDVTRAGSAPANGEDKLTVPTGLDLRAAGVQASDMAGGGKMLVFAINNHDRFSNAATNEYDVNIDTNGDNKPDYVVLAADSGQIRSGDADGLSEVFVYNVATKALSSSGYLSVAPTDSGTVLLPVEAADLGLTQAKGPFSYSVMSSSLEGPFSDTMSGVATYNPWNKAISDDHFVTVGINKTATQTLSSNGAAFAQQKPLGSMVVSLDNAAGAPEAILLPAAK